MLTGTLGELAKDWLFPRGATPALVTAIEDQRARDRKLLAQLAEAHAGHWAILRDSLEARPDLQAGLVGSAGLRFAANATPRQRARVEAASAGLAVEMAAAAGIEATLRVEATSTVALPNSGYLIRLPEQTDEVTLRVRGRGASVQADGVQVELKLTSNGEAGLDPAQADPRVVQQLPNLGKLGLELGGISTVIELPPNFELLQEVPGEAQTQVLLHALAVLKHTNHAMYQEMVALPVWIALLKRGSQRLSLTADGLPNLVYTNLIDPLETVDLLVHEYHHLKLDLLQETTPLLKRPRIPVVAPWRPELRTAGGVLHGAYVFANVARAFDSIMDMGQPSDQGRRRRAAWRAAVLRGIELLRESDAGVTEAGEQLLCGMEDDARSWMNDHAMSDRDELAWAELSVDRHVDGVLAGSRPEPLYMTGVGSVGITG